MSHGITTPLRVEKLDDGRSWRVLERFIYPLESGDYIDVPVGFVTDFASVPRFFWRVVNPVGKIGKPAVVHDKLYRAPVVVRLGLDGAGLISTAITRAECDRIFLEAMGHAGVNWFERRAAYTAVRLFGGFSFMGGSDE